MVYQEHSLLVQRFLVGNTVRFGILEVCRFRKNALRDTAIVALRLFYEGIEVQLEVFRG